MNQRTTFFFSFLFLAIFFLLFLWLPFISTVILAMIFASVLHPAYERILGYFKGRNSVASVVAVVLFAAVVLVPLALAGTIVAGDIRGWIDSIPGYIDRPPVGVKRLLSFIGRILHVRESIVRNELVSQIDHLKNYVLEISAFFMANSIRLTINVLIFLMALFCFFRDGPRMLRQLTNIIPFPESQLKIILNRLNGVSKSAIKGMLLNSLAVMAISLPGFYISGLPVGLWCVAAGIGILIPVIGSLTVWTAASAALLFTTGLKEAIFIACYGIAVIGVCDNILGPYFMKGSGEISPIWILFSVLGGIHLLGVGGILIGPVIFALALAFVDAYRHGFEGQDSSIAGMAK